MRNNKGMLDLRTQLTDIKSKAVEVRTKANAEIEDSKKAARKLRSKAQKLRIEADEKASKIRQGIRNDGKGLCHKFIKKQVKKMREALEGGRVKPAKFGLRWNFNRNLWANRTGWWRADSTLEHLVIKREQAGHEAAGALARCERLDNEIFKIVPKKLQADLFAVDWTALKNSE